MRVPENVWKKGIKTYLYSWFFIIYLLHELLEDLSYGFGYSSPLCAKDLHKDDVLSLSVP